MGGESMRVRMCRWESPAGGDATTPSLGSMLLIMTACWRNLEGCTSSAQELVQESRVPSHWPEGCQKPQPPLLLQKSVAKHSNLYCSTPPIYIAVLWVPHTLWGRGNTASTPPICIAVINLSLPFVLQCASHLYRNTFGKILVVVVTGCSPPKGSLVAGL